MAPQVQPDEINLALDSISRQILPDGLTMRYVAVDRLREQDVNPRSMPIKMFQQLVDNIAHAGGLESVPLCVETADGFDIISGHHRVRAARAAGIDYLLVFVYRQLSPSQVAAKQLAHNTIAGQDDPELVQRVWEKITDVSAKFEAFVDPRVFQAVPEPVRFKQVDVNVRSQVKRIFIVFLPTQFADFEAAIETLQPLSDTDHIYLAHRDTFDGFKAALAAVQSDLDITSAPTAIAEMAALVLAQRTVTDD